MRSFEDNLVEYARLAVRAGVNLQPGQDLLLQGDVSQAPLLRLIAEQAYKAGARHVQTVFSDEKLSRIRYDFGSQQTLEYAPAWYFEAVAGQLGEGMSRLVVISDDPFLMDGVDSAKIATSSKATGMAARPMMNRMSEFDAAWCVMGAASPAWAATVFPNESPDAAVRKLWDAIFQTCRMDADDPVAGWRTHRESLQANRARLNDMHLTELRFKGPGTDLRVGLADGAVWKGGGGVTKYGLDCSPNIPTEEVFTMPHRARVEGHVSSTKPLSLYGVLVDGIKAEFKDGVAVRASAEKGEEAFLNLLKTDEGASRLGEVALVPASSGIARTGIIFNNTLYDENAACHIAVGRAYGDNMANYQELGPDERVARGMNDSLVHVDWMIGSAEIDVDGVLPSGEVTALMRSGEWVLA